jgi:hypothetical protein
MTVTPELIDSVVQPLAFQFNWKTRMTPAQFKNAQSGEIGEDLTTSFLYNGRTYNLSSIQITAPTHRRWIIPYTQQVKNEEDIILTFSYTDLLTNEPQFVIFVIPVIRSLVQVGDPAYLVNFADPTITNQETSLRQLFPARTGEPYMYYNTCSQGFSANTPAQNVLVLVAIQGLYVSIERMLRIKSIFQRSAVQQDYGAYIPPLTLSFTGSFSVESAEKFSEYIKVTKEILNPIASNLQAAAGPLPELTMETNSYKCVTLDPEKQIDENGKIKIDPNGGVPLDSVKADRDTKKNDFLKVKTLLTKDVFSQYVSSALAIFFALIILSVVFFFFLGALIGPRAVGDGATFYQRMIHRMSRVPAYSIIGILAGFIGFMIGMIVKFR